MIRRKSGWTMFKDVCLWAGVILGYCGALSLCTGCVSPCAGMTGARYDACYDRQVRDLDRALTMPKYQPVEYRPPVTCDTNGGVTTCW